jgi:lipopolysaccharide exporter
MAETTQEPKFTSSLKWQSVNVTVQVVLQLGFIAALARIISPEAFGIMAIALVVVGFIEIFAQVGIGPALIQYSQVSKKHRQTAFVFSFALGIIFFAGTWLAAPALADFYEKPLLTTVLRWIALSFIISGASVVPRSMLIKEMRFKSLFISSAVAMVLGNLVIGLGLALNGADIFAYVYALLAQNTILGICYWIAYPGPVGLKMDKDALKDMVAYGGRSTVFNVINYAAGKVDTLIVGAYSGDWTLTGFYDRSAYLMGLPVTVLGKLGDSVLFSGLSMMQEDLERLRSTVLKASHAITILVIPLTALLVLRAEDFTVLLLGEQYLDAAPIVSILFMCVALRSFIKIGDASMRATDHLVIGAAIKLGFLIGITGGVWWAMNTFGLGDSNIRLAALVVFIATSVQTLAVATWLTLGLKINIVKLIPGLILCIPVVLLDSLFDLPRIDYAIEMAWRILPELGNAVSIAIHIAATTVITLALILCCPELLDGGFPEMRRKLLSRLPNSRFKTRLTR